MRKLLGVFLVLILLVIPILSDVTPMRLELMENETVCLSYTDHPKITIVGNGDFSTHFTGLGTPEQPYVFEGQNITDSIILVNITDTDAYCIIKDCFFRTAKDEILPAKAIVLDNASHVTIESCTFYNVSRVVEAIDSTNLTIVDSFSDEVRAADILLTDCPYANLTENTIVGSFLSGNPLIRLIGCNNSLAVGNNVTYTDIQINNSNETQILDNLLFESELYIYSSTDVVADYNEFDAKYYGHGLTFYSCYHCNASHNIAANQDDDAFTVYDSTEITLRNNTVYSTVSTTGNDYGILIDESLDCTIDNNTVSGNLFAGIGIANSNNTLLSDNIAFDNYHGFYDHDTFDTYFDECNAHDNTKRGYNIWGSERTHINHSNSTSNSEEGLFASSCFDVEITCCIALNNARQGFYIASCNNTLLWDSQALYNQREGFYVENSGYTHTAYCHCEGNNYGNFYFYDSDYGLFEWNDVSNSIAPSFEFEYSDFCDIVHAGTYRAGKLYLYEVRNVTVIDCTFSLIRNYAIHIDTSSNVSLLQNIIDDVDVSDYEAIFIEDSSNIELFDNQITNIHDSQIVLETSTNCILDSNSLSYGGLYIEGDLREHWAHQVSLDNNIAGKPIYYLVNESSAFYDMASAGQVFIVDCEDVSTTGGFFYGATLGYVFTFSTNCIASNFMAEDCRIGVLSQYSEDCTISSSEFYDGFYAIHGDNSPGLNITDCYAERFNEGLYLEYCTGSILDFNEVSNVTNYGIELSSSPNSILTNNTLSLIPSSAMRIASSESSHVEDNVMIDSINWGITLYSSHGCVLAGNEIDVDEMGISLFNTNGGYIISNTVNGDQACIYLQSTQDLEIYSNTLSSTGILIPSTNMNYFNHTLSNNQVGGLPIAWLEHQANLDLEALDYGQIILLYCENLTISGSEMLAVSVPVHLASCNNVSLSNYSLIDVYYGLWSYNSTHCSVVNYTIVSSSNTAVYLDHSHNTTLSGVNTSLSGYHGIYLYQSEDCAILDSEIWNCSQTGVYAQNSFSLQISNVRVINCSIQGIYLYYSNDVDVSEVLVIDCIHGMQLYHALDCNVTNSGFFNNTNGIYVLSSSTNNLFYLNEFGGNTGHNAWDDVAGNDWDDGVMYGNSWSDYAGGGFYFVYGTGGGIDGYPNGLPGYTIILSSPDDQTFYEGSSGKSITWTSSSGYIRFYQLYLNSSFQSGGSWTGGPVVVNLNGLTPGYYIYNLVLTSYFASSASDTVEITILEVTTPTIDSPDDIWYWYGDIDNIITWNAASSDPDVFEMYINGTLYGPYTWDGADVEGNVDDFDVGTYNITIIVYSGCGNSVMDTVFLIVRARSIPEINHPDDIWYWYGSEGNSILWEVSCTYPDEFWFIIGEGIIDSGPWDGLNIEIDVDGFEVGAYNLTLVVFSESDNYTYDTVLLTVRALSTPSINHPDDISFIEGTTGESITWIVSDSYPDSYELLHNGVVIDSDEWDELAIIVSLDDLEVGTHNFTLVVYSECGLYSSDSVIVVVTTSGTTSTDTTTGTTSSTTSSTTTDTTTPTDDSLGQIMLIAGAGGGILALLLVLMLLRKRQSG